MKISVTAKWQMGDRSGERSAQADIEDSPLYSDDQLDEQIQRTVGALFAGLYADPPPEA